MIIKPISDPFDVLLFDNVFSDEELSEIWKELDFLTRRDILLPPEETGAALYDDGTPKKSNSAVFLDNMYVNPNHSSIKKILSTMIDNSIADEMINLSYHHEMIKSTSRLACLVSYYESNDHYDFHKDVAMYTMLFYLYKEPKGFSGGELELRVNDSELIIPITNNSGILFPSFYDHKVHSVKLNDGIEEFSGYGRYCITQFLYGG